MKEDILLRFGSQVKKQRLKQHLSQEELAERAGVHRTYVGMIERAEKNITLLTIQKLAKALDVSVARFFKGL
jgi:transcriptional regulator with XRE-family HTH domain